VAARLKEGDPRAGDEAAALREAIAKTTNSDQLGALAQAYAAVAAWTTPGTVKPRDFAVLLQSMKRLRNDAQCEAFSAALNAASQPRRSSLAWQKIGLIYAEALLEPVCAGATEMFVNHLEEVLHRNAEVPEANRPKEKWSGDVWEFVLWAEKNLPGFDPHKEAVGFLPPVGFPPE